MSTWNMRIIYHDKDEHPWYGVHEVFYNEDKSIWSYTLDAVDITGETEEELKKYLGMVVNDINRAPILIESEIHCTADNEELDPNNHEWVDFDDLITTGFEEGK